MKTFLCLLSLMLMAQAAQAQTQQLNKQPDNPPQPQGQLGWVQVPSGTTKPVNSLSFPTRDTAFAWSGPSLRSVDGGQTWQTFALPVSNAYHFLDGKTGYTMGYTTDLAYSTHDGGQTWITANDSNQLCSIVVVPSKDTAFIFGDEVSRTTDGGKIWTLQIPPNHAQIKGAAFYDAKHGVFVGYTQPGPLPMHPELTAGCFTTSNAGETWEQEYCGAGQALSDVIYVNADTVVAVGGQGYVTRSTNGGSKWDSIPCPFYGPPDAVAYKGGRLLAVGAAGLIISSTDAGLTWQKQQSGTTLPLYTIAMCDSQNALAAGVSGIILKTTNGGIEWIQTSPQSNQDLQSHTFPEPSHGLVQIEYALPQLQDVTLTIIDLTGRVVATLLNKQLQPQGSHTIPFDGSRYPAGTYTYQLQTERYHASGKFTIVK